MMLQRTLICLAILFVASCEQQSVGEVSLKHPLLGLKIGTHIEQLAVRDIRQSKDIPENKAIISAELISISREQLFADCVRLKFSPVSKQLCEVNSSGNFDSKEVRDDVYRQVKAYLQTNHGEATDKMATIKALQKSDMPHPMSLKRSWDAYRSNEIWHPDQNTPNEPSYNFIGLSTLDFEDIGSFRLDFSFGTDCLQLGS